MAADAVSPRVDSAGGAVPETRRCFTLLVALAVTDRVSYARYREAMMPILAEHGGAFGCDFSVAEVLRGADARVNRVFTISFPDRTARDRFFADARYARARALHFEPAVAVTQILAQFHDLGADAAPTE